MSIQLHLETALEEPIKFTEQFILKPQKIIAQLPFFAWIQRGKKRQQSVGLT